MFSSLNQTGSRSTRDWLVGLLLVAATLAVFWPATGFEFINMDDDVYVTANAQVLGGLSWENARWAFVGLKAGFWHPVTWLSLQADATMWGRGAAGFHRTNILLHAANVGLVFVLLRLLTGSLWRSAMVAALFALHPLRVEPVAWVSGRKELLAAFFGLLALICHVCYSQITVSSGKTFNIQHSTSNTQGWYWLAIFFFALALMSKPMVVMLPVMMLLLDYWPLQRISSFEFRVSSWWPLVREKIPFFALGLVVGMVTLFGDSHFVKGDGLVVPMIQHSAGLRMENAVVSYVRYLAEMFWPVKLGALYPYPAAYSFWAVAGALLVLAVISIFAVLARRPFWLVGWLWYLLALLPVIGLIQVGPHSHADRYTYLPMIGLVIALVWGAGEWLEEQRVSRRTVAGLVILILATCVVGTRNQLRYWQSSGDLFAHTAAVTEENYMAHALRGHYLAGKGLTDAAIESFVKTIEINPDYADAWNNLGLAVAAKGRGEEAMADYRRALQINPGHAGAWNNFGAALAARGRVGEAIECYRRALAVNPNQAATLNNLGYVLVGQGKAAEAIPYYLAAVRVQPQEAGFRMNLAAALMGLNRRAEGLAQYREALRLNPELKEIREFLKAMGDGR